MNKRRTLITGQSVIIIYTKEIGYTKDFAVFKEYRKIDCENFQHSIPIFEYNQKEISGRDCFWILPTDINSEKQIEKLQYEIISLQVYCSIISKELGYKMENKIINKELDIVAQDKFNQINSLINKLGFDPRDESWIEREMAANQKERNWFAFERQNPTVFEKYWPEMTELFNKRYKDTLSVDEAKILSKKRHRFLLGAFYTRMSGNASKEDWKQSSRKFEQDAREIEERMIKWSLERNNIFPMIKVKQPIQFTPGPYFHNFIEKYPNLFTDVKISHIKAGVILRVVSFDPKTRMIRLDFLSEIRNNIKNENSDQNPWIKDEADYLIWVKPEQIETHLMILEKF